MKSFKTYILAEASNLGGSELHKYDWRLELFLDKFKKESEFDMVGGTRVKFKYDQTVENKLREKSDLAKIEFYSYNGLTYKLKDFAKSKEFGGGGGTGAGADVTKMTESAQAVYAAARWNGSKEYTTDQLTKGYSYSDTDETLENILHNLTNDWRNSCILGAEKLYSAFGAKGYTFHRGSSWVNRLEKLFKKLNASEKQFSNLNKWSPADIYLVSAVGASIKLEEATNIIQLNNILLEALKTKDIIGVSLKLLKGTAKLSYYNFDAKKKVIEFDKFTTGNKGFFSGKDVYIYFTLDGKIQFRTFPETFQGEIKGKNANQGKLSYGPIQGILRNLKLSQLTDVKKLKNGLTKYDLALYKEFYLNYSRYSNDSTKLTLPSFVEECKVKGVSWAFSKYLGCELISIIKKSGREDEFITACIQYASSSSELSAPFIKLE
jgi:hypothetical protein